MSHPVHHTTHHEQHSAHHSGGHAEVDLLRKDIASLRKQLDTHPSAALAESMDRLHDVLSKLVALFENANREIYDEYSKGLHDEMSRFDALTQQNEKIAKGVIALADMIKGTQAPAPLVKAPVTPVVIATPIPASNEQGWQGPHAPIAQPPLNPTMQAPPPLPPPRATPIPLDEDSFMRQPVQQLAVSPVQNVPPPPPKIFVDIGQAPPVPAPSTMQTPAPPMTMQPLATLPPLTAASTPVPQPSPLPASFPALPPLGQTPPPPLPPPSPPAAKRGILDKFSFR